MEIRPHNPKLLLLDGDGKPVPFAHILFYEEGTDVPASVFVEETSAETTFVIADDSGFFPSVILHPRKYTLRSFVPMDGVENPSFPDDFVAYESWNLDGGDAPDADETEVAFVSSLAALRDVDTSAYSAADVNGVRYALYPNSFPFPDDGGFAIVPNDASGNVWIAVLDCGRLPITLFGADASGQASSSAAIAVAFACVSYYAQTPRSPVPMPTAVYFPYGNYKIEEDISATAPVVVAEYARITNATDHSLNFTLWDKYQFESENTSVFVGGNPVVLKYKTRTPHFVNAMLDGGVGAVDAANVGENAEVFWATSLSLQSGSSVSIPRVIVPAAGLAIDKAGAASLYIGAFDFTSGGKLDLNAVTGKVEVGCEIRTSQLANAARDWTKLKGPRLVVDEAVSLIANAALYFDEVFVAIAHGVKNETAAPLSFVNAGAMGGMSGSIDIQNVLLGRVSPIAVDWTGCGSAEFSAFVVAHGCDADFEGVSISANLSLSFGATLRRLNLTGDLTMNNAAVELRECSISGNVSAWTARVFDSSIGGSLLDAVDVEATGSRFNIIHPRVGQVTDPTPRQGISFRLYRCNIADAVYWKTVHPLRNLVIRECSVDNACFFKKQVGGVWNQTYGLPVEDWDTAENVNIDISDNTTVDNTSGKPLLRSKGFTTLDGAEQSGDGFYLTRLGSKGIVDFLNVAGTQSRIGDVIFSPFAVGNCYTGLGGNSMPNATQYQKDSGNYAAARRTASSSMVAFLDPWNTQTNW